MKDKPGLFSYIKTNVVIGKSKIHGKGVFAIRDMPKGYYVGEYEGPLTGPGVSKFDFHDYDTGKARRGRNDLRYMNSNHDDPNCDFDKFDCFTTRKITKGEELTFSYETVYE